MPIPELYILYKKSGSISTDTRNIQHGALFFALKGSSFNGNTFAGQALDAGAAFAVIDEAAFKTDERYIVVNDVLTTLQELAKYHRSQLTIPVLGITGSNGKTTTKELMASVLSQRFKAWATKGNLNNHIGVPITLLSMPADTEIAIIEMGANHPGEIGFLCNICNPTHGIITNVGKAHLEGFGGFEGVIRTKKELYDHIRMNDGLIFIRYNDPHLHQMAEGITKRVTYGTSAGADIRGEAIQAFPLSVKFSIKNSDPIKAETNLSGEYNLDNILAAVAVGDYFGMNANEIAEGLELYEPSNNRSQIVNKGSNQLILDAYNANPSSMEASLRNFDRLDFPRKVIILGDMFELGEESEAEHKQILELLKTLTFDKCFVVGSDFFKHRAAYSSDLRFYFTGTTSEAMRLIGDQNFKDTCILIKGSRGMRLEDVAEAIR